MPSMAASASAGDEWRLSRPTTTSLAVECSRSHVPNAWPIRRATSGVSGGFSPRARPRKSFFLNSFASIAAINRSLLRRHSSRTVYSLIAPRDRRTYDRVHDIFAQTLHMLKNRTADPRFAGNYPGIRCEWINFYGEDGIFAFPFRALNGGYGKATANRAASSGGRPVTGPPLPRLERGEDRKR